MAMMSTFLASWVFMCPNDPLRAYGSIAARWTGCGIALVGFCLPVGGVVRLKKVENIDHLVTTGLFAHPAPDVCRLHRLDLRLGRLLRLSDKRRGGGHLHRQHPLLAQS